jgi:hypothetical protein
VSINSNQNIDSLDDLRALEKFCKKKKISKKLMGHKQSEDTRRKKSESHKGKIISQETRDKLSIANKGKRLSDEAKKRMIESNKKTWARKTGREYIPPEDSTKEDSV